MATVDGEPRGAVTWRYRPAVQDRQGFGVDLDDLALILDIDVDVPAPVRSGEFRPAAQRDGARHFLRAGVNGGAVLAAAVEGKDAVGARIENDRIRALSHRDGRVGLESLQVEGGDGAGAAVAGKAAVERVVQGDAMHALGIGDIAYLLPFVNVNHHDVCAARDVEAARRAVNVESVPAAISGE